MWLDVRRCNGEAFLPPMLDISTYLPPPPPPLTPPPYPHPNLTSQGLVVMTHVSGKEGHADFGCMQMGRSTFQVRCHCLSLNVVDLPPSCYCGSPCFYNNSLECWCLREGHVGYGNTCAGHMTHVCLQYNFIAKCQSNCTSLKQNEAQSARAESTHKGVNYARNITQVITQVQRMPDESYRGRIRSLLLYLCYVFRMLINSLGCWQLLITHSRQS